MPGGADCQGLARFFSWALIAVKTIRYEINSSKSFNLLAKKITDF
jgi:hypothetical protein